MVEPAAIEWDADGTPYAPRFGDIYHARAGALGQARHVFLGGNRLAERWRQGKGTAAGRGFTILETGFGLGTNFLAAWDAWRAAAAPPAPLRYVGIEMHPPLRADFERMHVASPLRPLADELAARWPAPAAGPHRIDLDAGDVSLLLVHLDAAAAIERLRTLDVPPVDAYFLDGFAPARNPGLWSAALLSRLACLAAPDATAATWSSARRVRDALAAAGFAVQRVPGYAGKREMTVARRAAPPSTGQQAE